MAKSSKGSDCPTASPTTDEVNTLNIAAACRQAMRGAENYREGANRLLEAAKKDRRLYDAIVGPHEFRAALNAIHTAMASERQKIWRVVERTVDKARQAGGLHLLAEVSADIIYDFRLPDGKRLGDARRPDVQAARARTTKYRETYERTEYWLGGIEAALPNDEQTVSEALTPKDLVEIQSQFGGMYTVEVVDAELV